MTLTQGLCNTPFTLEWLVDILLCNGKYSATVTSHNAMPIGVGQGFLSHIVRVQFTWTGKDADKMPKSVVMKVPTTNTLTAQFNKMDLGAEHKEQLQDDMVNLWLPLAHGNECKFYEMFAKTKPNILMPKTYFAKELGDGKEGVIVMEDFSLMNGITINKADGMNLEQVKKVIENLAVLHTWCLRTPGEWENRFVVMGKEAMSTWPEMMKAIAQQLTTLDAEKFPENSLDELRWAFEIDYAFTCMTMDTSKKLGVPQLLVHGDLWTNNMLFAADENHLPTNKLLALIDWQVVHPGNICEDIARMLVSSCPGELRRTHTNTLLHYYYDCLTKELKHTPAFTFEQLKQAYDLILPFAMCFYVFSVPMMCMSPIVGEGEVKEKRVKELLSRAKMIMDDVVGLKDNAMQFVKENM
jgi:thiamine kinase-like enzyme